MAAHEVGGLSELLSVSRDNIRTCDATMQKEIIRDAPTLVQLREEALELQRVSKARYEQSLQIKPLHKAQLRTWHRLKGALLHLRRLDAAKVVAAAKQQRNDKMDGSDNTSDELSVTQDGETAPQFLSKWMGVRDILKTKLAVLGASALITGGCICACAMRVLAATAVLGFSQCYAWCAVCCEQRRFLSAMCEAA